MSVWLVRQRKGCFFKCLTLHCFLPKVLLNALWRLLKTWWKVWQLFFKWKCVLWCERVLCVCVCVSTANIAMCFTSILKVCVCVGGAGSPVSPATILCLISFQHDNNIASLGRAIGIFNNLQPPYLASIILELHEQDGNFFVKTLFENHTSDSPYTKTIKGLS